MPIVNMSGGLDYLTNNQVLSKDDREEIKKLNEQLREMHQGSKVELKEEDFLKVLTTQLKNQNPTDPIDDKTFISQMAQLTTLKELNNLNANILALVSQNSINSSLSMISKTIDWINQGDGKSFSDKVIGIRLNENGEVFLKTQRGDLVSIKDVIEVK